MDLYLEYLKLKEKEPTKIYLFKQGAFFLALGDDAEILNKELGLKLTSYQQVVKKCGFPVRAVKKYQKFLDLLKLKYEKVYGGTDVVVYDLLKLDVNRLKGEEAIKKIKEYQLYLKGIVDA